MNKDNGPKGKPMPILIVPNSLRIAIEEKVDKAIDEHPSLSPDRELICHDLLAIFIEHGHLNVEIIPNPRQQ
jgi:hypothetical protein